MLLKIEVKSEPLDGNLALNEPELMVAMKKEEQGGEDSIGPIFKRFRAE